MVICSHRRPRGFFSKFVKSYFWLEEEIDSVNAPFQRVTPDGCTEVNFNLGAPVRRKEASGRTFIQDDFYLINRVSQHYFVQQTAQVSMFGIKFQPWGLRPFIKIKRSEVTDKFLTHEEVFGRNVKVLQEKVLHTINVSDIIATVEDFFVRELYDTASDDLLVVDAMQKILAANGKVDLDRIYSRYGLTPRRIQQRFSDFAGTSPKMFARLVKFRFALKKLHSITPHGSLTNVAYDAGYYDQSHFIHDFKFFAGVNPQRYLSNNHTLNLLMAEG